MQAFHFVGTPEGILALAEAAIYMATAPKSNALYKAHGSVIRDVKETLAEPVPMHLRNAPTRLMKDLGYGEGYRYAHDYSEHVADMSCLPSSLLGRKYFSPSCEGFEATLRERIKEWQEKRKRSREETGRK
jgi:putative ATPase